MSTKFKFLSLAVIAMLSFSSASFAQDDAGKEPGSEQTKERPSEEKKATSKELDSKKFLADLSKKYQAYKTYTLKIKGAMDMGMMKLNQNVTVHFKAKNKIRSKTELVTPMGNQVVETYSNGDKAYLYISAPQKRFMKVATDSQEVMSGEPLVLALLMGKIDDMTEKQGASIKVTEVTVGDKVEHHLSLETDMGQASVKALYKFDKDGKFLGGSSETTMTGPQRNPMMPKSIKRTSTVESVEIDKEIADTVFDFTPPEDAVEGMGGMPGMGGGRRPSKPEEKKEEPKDDDADDF